MHIDITSEEAQMLREVLGSYLSDLRMEISNTENMSFREELKKREEFLKKLIKHLEEGGTSKSEEPHT
ncbi:MAG TPA: hypothetical protein VHT73_12470 [Thermodesulfobacteriota bacterium]|nr:hypothetical protein [Thermodesulfobacteriota bacterium]